MPVLIHVPDRTPEEWEKLFRELKSVREQRAAWMATLVPPKLKNDAKKVPNELST